MCSTDSGPERSHSEPGTAPASGRRFFEPSRTRPLTWLVLLLTLLTRTAQTAVSVDEFVADTKFSHDRGYYDTPFAVTLTCDTPGAVIRYTTNSEPPDEISGIIYSDPIPITGTTVLRAAAFKPGLIPSNVDTHTYLFLADIASQPVAPPGFPTSWGAVTVDYAMDPEVLTNAAYADLFRPALWQVPTLSLVTTKSNLWDATNGIYSHSQNRGDDWERPVSFEYLNPATGEQFQLDGGIRIHGGVSRSGSKQALNVHFRGLYGTPTLRFPLFPGNPIERFDALTLRGQWNDGWHHPGADNRTGLYLRDEWSRRTFIEMGRLDTFGGFMHLFIDGLYWGLYNPVEHINAAFVAYHLGGAEEDYDVVKFNGGPTIEDGDLVAWNSLMALAAAGLSTAAAYENIQRYLDVDDLIDYLLLFIYGGNEDGPGKNYYAYFNKHSPDGRWRFITWDTEWSLGNSFTSLDKVDVDVSNSDAANTAFTLYHALRANPEFRVRFGDHAQRHFFNGGALSLARNQQRLGALAAGITNAIIGESARWGDFNNRTSPGHPYTRNAEWVSELNFMFRTFFPQREPIVLRQLRSLSLFPTLGAPVFSQFGGGIPAGFSLEMTHTNSTGAILFTLDGADPRLPGGNVAASAQSYAAPLTLNAQTLVRARVKSGANWSALVETSFFPPQDLTALQVSEIMYHPAPAGAIDGDEFEFLELKNNGTQAIDLGGLAFTAGITFTFTNGSTLGPGSFVVLVRNPVQFAARYPGVAFHGVYSGRLDNNGETLTLSHPLGGTVLSVSYDDGLPWPLTADGTGFSLVPIGPGVASDASRADHWRASAQPGGSPGADDPDTSIAPIRINELLSRSGGDDAGADRVELFNPTDREVDVSGWFLSDDPALPRRFPLPTNSVISPQGYLAFSFTSSPGNDAELAFSARGDDVVLFSADAQGNLTGYSHGFTFGASATGVSFGRHVISTGEEQFPAQRELSLGNANTGPLVGPVVISEIHYHPEVGDDEFIELRNITTNAVPLYDPAYPTNAWRLNGLGYTFPTNLVLGSNQVLLVVPTAPEAFRLKYSVSPEVLVIGPYTGVLQNTGERLELQQPSLFYGLGFIERGYITVDEVRYNDKSPWPVAADGSGASLQRKHLAEYGNDPANWEAANPTPGAEFPGGLTPVIRRQPQSVSALVGDTVVMTVQADGPGPLSYQWRFKGGVLAGATDTMLVLTNVTPAQAGNYTVVVFNAAGSAASAVAELTLHPPPFILTQPANQGARIGTAAQFTVLASGNGILRYQWRFEGIPLDGATNAILNVTNVQLSSAGNYSVIVRDAFGSIASSNAALLVLINPVILEQPVSVSAPTGSTVTFSVSVAEGATWPIGYRWRRNGATVGFQSLSQNQAFFTLTNVQVGGNYTVVVTNAATPTGILSSSAALTLVADADRDGIGDDWELAHNLNPGLASDAALDPDGDGLTNLQEYLAGTDPADAASRVQLRIEPPLGSSSLHLQAMAGRTYTVEWKESAEIGTWSKLADVPARATNFLATISDLFPFAEGRIYRALTPRLPDPPPGPVLLASPRSLVLEEGDSVVLQARASGGGTGPLTYQWRFNSTAIPGATSSSLPLTQARFADAGSYSVTVTGSARAITSAPPAIVAVRPRILASPPSQSVVPGSSLTLQVEALGAQPLLYQWLKNGKPIAGETNASLIIPAFQDADAGTYRVSVSHLTDLGRIGRFSEPAVISLK